jgi:predicted RNA-binding Zn-ribbon protein involved in translation (DUF1610 family)
VRRINTSYSDIQEEFFETTGHDAHHHSLDRCLKILEERKLEGFIHKLGYPLFDRRNETDGRTIFYYANICAIYEVAVAKSVAEGDSIWDIVDDEKTLFWCLEDFFKNNNFKCKECGASGHFKLDIHYETDRDISTLYRHGSISYNCDVCGFSIKNTFSRFFPQVFKP